VVEGWIGLEGIRAAAAEFQERGYQYVVTTGGMTDGRWDDRRGNYAEMAERVLVRSGVPEDRIIVARADDTKSRRTYESALAVLRALHARGTLPKSLNVFTMGPHARRSRMVFAKVEGPGTKVGVVAWIPSDYQNVPWWRSSDRAKELLTETAGYIYESLLNSGRRSNDSGKDSSVGLAQRLVLAAKAIDR
jgi:DUF218 domain-containing protein